MRIRNAFTIVAVLIGLPVVVAGIEAAKYAADNRSNRTIVWAGETRDYILYVPPGYDAKRPTPLVVTIHGASIWPAAQQELSQWNRVADREGFIVVYPAGRGDGPLHFDPEDAGFVSRLIDEVQRTHNIDRARIYVNGLSNGGGLSLLMACTMADRIAAVGLVAAAHLFDWRMCTDSTPVPMIAFHGTADGAAPYYGGMSWVIARPWPSIPAQTAAWARRNQCAPTPIESRVAPDVTRLEYTQCAGDAPMILYTIEGGGHTWPGGRYLPQWFAGYTTQSIDASSMMWEFFKAHPLPQP